MSTPTTSFRGPRWAGLRRSTATVAAVSAALISSITTVSLAATSHSEAGSGVVGLIALGFVLNLAAGVLLVWRHRWPWGVWALAVAAPLVGETDALAALVALVAVLRVVDLRRGAAAVLVTTAAAGVSLYWDAGRSGDFSVLRIWRPVEAGTAVEPYDVAGWVPPLVAIGLVALTTGIGLLLRTRSALDVATVRGDRATAEQRALREEVVRAEERTRIARDMHDTLANRLSRISLMAGGLVVGGPEEPTDEARRVQERAELIHGAAHEAMSELRSAVGVLRGAPTAAAPDGLAAVSGLVESARRAGVHVVLTLDLASTAAIDPAVEHVAFRMVQEGVTNGQKHAGGQAVRVAVVGSPPQGITVQVRNRLPHDPLAVPPGRGAGLTGLGEQTAAVGGSARGGVEPTAAGPEFVLHGWVPWRG